MNADTHFYSWPNFRGDLERVDRSRDANAGRKGIEAAGAKAAILAKINRRNLIKRLFNRLKNLRRFASCYD